MLLDVKPTNSGSSQSTPSPSTQHGAMTSHDGSTSTPVANMNTPASMSLNAAYHSMLTGAHNQHMMNSAAGALPTYGLSTPDMSGDMTSSAHTMTNPITAIQNAMMQGFFGASPHVNASLYAGAPMPHHHMNNDVKVEDEKLSPFPVKTESDHVGMKTANHN